MKYIKTFENSKGSNPKFKIGDFVYCINSENSNNHDLQENIKYEILSVQSMHVGDVDEYSHFYFLKEIPHTMFFEKRFISEIEYEAKKYNL